jgi:hypothetical protein
LAEWLGGQGRPLLEPRKWARRSGLPQRPWGAADPRRRLRRRQEVRRPSRPGGQGQPARPPSLVCHPHVGSRGRRAGRPRAPRPRLHRHDPALHEGFARTPPPCLRGRPPAGGNNEGEGPRSMTPCRTRLQRRTPPT